MSKLDELIAEVATIKAGMGFLENRAEEDRDEAKAERRLQTDRHEQNQRSMGEMRQNMASALAEVRQSIASLTTAVVKRNGHGDPALSTPQRAALVVIAVAFLGALAWIAEILFGSAVTWIISHMKFGSS